jgi:hypothetical protein
MGRIPRVTAVAYVGDLRLNVSFDDGAEGEADLAPYFFEGKPGFLGELADKALFAKAYVHPEAHTVAWPNGVEFDPLLLWSEVTGNPIPIPSATRT